MNDRQDLLGLLEGFYLTSITDVLHRTGALAALQSGAPVERVAHACGFDPQLLMTVTCYLAARTTGILPDASLPVVDSAFLGHLLDQYKGAFGPCVDRLEAILRAPAAGAQYVDWHRHQLAFGSAGRGASNQITLQLLAELGADCIVDLGCSAGGLLLDFAQANPAACGWGIDSSAAAIAAASRAAEVEHVSARMCFRVASADEPASGLSAEERARVQVVTAFNLANAFFDAQSGMNLPLWIARLQAAFPGCLLLLGDYYGKVGTCSPDTSHRYRRAMLHDVAQALTAQGIPPADIDGWRRALTQTGATLVKAFEGEHDEVAHFVYLMQL